MSGYAFKTRERFDAPWVSITVPEDFWTLSIICAVEYGKMSREVQVLGGEVIASLLQLLNGGTSGQFVLTSRKPFGVIGEKLDNPFNRWGDATTRFLSARQVHNSELCQYVPIPPIRVIQTSSLIEADKTDHWVSLREVLELTELDLDSFASTYSRFGDWTHGMYYFLHILVADDATIAGLEQNSYLDWGCCCTERDFVSSVSEEGVANVWISARFARTALRLHALNYASTLSAA